MIILFIWDFKIIIHEKEMNTFTLMLKADHEWVGRTEKVIEFKS